MTEYISWLSQGVRLDLNYTALQLSKKKTSATIVDLWNINQVLQGVKCKSNRVCYGSNRDKDNQQKVRIRYAFYRQMRSYWWCVAVSKGIYALSFLSY